MFPGIGTLASWLEEVGGFSAQVTAYSGFTLVRVISVSVSPCLCIIMIHKQGETETLITLYIVNIIAISVFQV